MLRKPRELGSHPPSGVQLAAAATTSGQVIQLTKTEADEHHHDEGTTGEDQSSLRENEGPDLYRLQSGSLHSSTIRIRLRIYEDGRANPVRALLRIRRREGDPL